MDTDTNKSHTGEDMGLPQMKIDWVSPQDYLEGENDGEAKHEYVDGEIYAMSGASLVHNDVCLNFYDALRRHARGRGCRVNLLDVKVHIEAANTWFYPDVVVSCEEPEEGDPYALTHPRLIAEVLSPSTEANDRGRKFDLYRLLPSLSEYVLVSQACQSVHVYTRGEAGTWTFRGFGAHDEIHLRSLDLTVGVDALYEGTDVPEKITLRVLPPERHPEPSPEGGDPMPQAGDR